MNQGLHVPEELLDKIDYILTHLAEKAHTDSIVLADISGQVISINGIMDEGTPDVVAALAAGDVAAMASNHVNILRLSADIDDAYMALVFQSIIGQLQTQQHARGSAQAELYPADVDRFVVPILDFVTQKAIGNLVRASLDKQRKSKLILEQAKSRVEQLIEEAATA